MQIREKVGKEGDGKGQVQGRRRYQDFCMDRTAGKRKGSVFTSRCTKKEGKGKKRRKL